MKIVNDFLVSSINSEAVKMVEIPKEIVDKVLEAIEVAKATGKIKKGTNEVTKALERGNAKLVAVAKDANPPEIVMHLPLLSKEKGVACVEVPSKEELGASAGLDVPTASVAIVQEGEAKSLVNEITAKLGKPAAAEKPKAEQTEKPKEVSKKEHKK